jgi:hypothetical protein
MLRLVACDLLTEVFFKVVDNYVICDATPRKKDVTTDFLLIPLHRKTFCDWPSLCGMMSSCSGTIRKEA